MIKRLLPFIILILIAVPVTLFFLRDRDKEVKVSQSAAIGLVPDDAFWIIESASVPDLLTTLSQSDPLFPSLQMFGEASPYLQAMKRIDSLIDHSPRFKQAYANSPVVLSMHQTAKNIFQFLIVVETPGTSGVLKPGEMFAELCGRPGQWSERTYNSQKIHRISFGADALIQGMSLVELNDYLIMSPSPVLLENALRQQAIGKGLTDEESFRKLSQTRGAEALAHLYVNLKGIPRWLGAMMNPGVRKKMENFTRYGDWAVLDLRVKNDALCLTGFAMEGDTLNSFLGVFRNQEPLKLTAEQFLPSNTAAFYSIGIEKPESYFRDLSDFMGGGEAGRNRQRNLDLADQLSGENFLKAWNELGISELTIGYLAGAADESVSSIALIGTQNRNQTSQKLLKWLDAVAGKVPGKTRLQRQTYKVDSETEYEIYPVPVENMPMILGGGFFSPVRGEFYAFAGNTLVIADDVQTLKDVLHFYTIGRVLANDPFFQSVSDLISSRSNVTFYAVPHKVRPLLKTMLGTRSLETLASDEEFLRQTGSVCMQFHSRNGMFLHNLFARFVGMNYSKPQTIWESRLDAKIAGSPAWVVNHTTGEPEITVQDENGQFYLLNSSGRILWKKMIGEKINSDIYQIDVMKNGKLQYLFSTPSAIHMLDRNGNYLPKFPLALPSVATNGLSVIDFDKTRDYRFLIAGTDKRLYCLDKNGNPVKGWEFKETTGPVTHPVQHLKIRNKDYLVFTDDLKVYILDRKGAVKVSPDKDIPISANNQLQYDGQASDKGSRFLVTDVDGNVYAIHLDGTVESTKLDSYGPDHYFAFEDLNQDGLKDYVFVDKNRLDVFAQNGEKIISRKFDAPVAGLPLFFTFDAKVKEIGLVLSGKNDLMLIKGDGSVHDGFPLKGATPFALSAPEKGTGYRNLIVGSNDRFLFNYALK